MSQYPRINMTNLPLNSPSSQRVFHQRNPRRDFPLNAPGSQRVPHQRNPRRDFSPNSPGSQRVFHQRNQRRDFTRRECRSTPVPQPPMGRVQQRRRSSTDPVGSTWPHNPTTRSLTPALHHTRRGLGPDHPVIHKPKVRFDKVDWNPREERKPRVVRVPAEPATLLPSFNTKPAPKRRSRISRFFRCLCCFG